MAALLLMPFLVPIPGELERMRGLRSLGVLAHFFLPAILTIVLYRRGRWRGSILGAATVAFVLSAGSELLQIFVGRHPRLPDALVDLAGVVTACGWLLRGERRAGLARLVLLLGMAVLLIKLHALPGFFLAEWQVQRRFPLIADFESGIEMGIWGHNEKGHGRYDRWIGPTDDSIVLRLRAAEHHEHPGILARGLPRDWRGYGTLRFRARGFEGTPARIVVRLDDFSGRKDGVSVQIGFRLETGWKDFRVDLDSLASTASRPFRLDDIDSLLLYLNDVNGNVTVLIDDIVLE